MYIRTDTIGSTIHNNQRITSNKIQEAMNRLSTGLRINSARDDSAGLSISERLKGQIIGSNQAKRNIQDAISLSKTADGGLSIIQDQLQRMRELTIQAKNGTLSANDNSSIQGEINQLIKNIDNIAAKQTFNNIEILNDSKGINLSQGSAIVNVGDSNLYDMDEFTLESVVTPSVVTGNNELIAKEVSWKYRIFDGNVLFFVDDNGVGPWEATNTWATNLQPNETYNISLTYSTNNDSAELFVNGVSYGAQNISIGDTGGNGYPLQLGGYNNGVYSFDGLFQEARVYNRALTTNEIQENYNGIKTSDGLIGEWVFNNDGGTTIKDTSGSGKDANINLGVPQWEPGINIHVSDESDASFEFNLSKVKSGDIGITGLDVNDENALQKLDYAIDRISKERGKYGTYMNVMEYKLNNLETKTINTEQAKFRISDADMTYESSSLIKEQIKLQTSIQMLKQNDSNRQNSISMLLG